jgi:hypothetical protein
MDCQRQASPRSAYVRGAALSVFTDGGGVRVRVRGPVPVQRSGSDPHPPACPGARPVIYIGGSDKAAQNPDFFVCLVSSCTKAKIFLMNDTRIR